MKISSWNVNGIRAIYKKGELTSFFIKENMDVLFLQEVKALKQNIPKEIQEIPGYKFYVFPAKKPGYSGVAAYVKEDIKCGIEYGIGIKDFDDEGRVISVNLDKLSLIGAYFPNSQSERRRINYKLEFCDAMLEHLNSLKKKTNIVLSGDYNIAHKKIDLANPDANTNSPGFYEEERRWMDKFIENDFVDTFRMFKKESGNYTWWSYRTRARERNVGWRIDYHSVNKEFKKSVKESYHNTDVMGSDHCPVTIII
jgi:exodeoxyribonuclease III